MGSKPLTYSFVSSHLVNAYTIDNYIPSGINIHLINYYGHATSPNDGFSIPTFLLINGTLSSEDYLDSNTLLVFFD